MNPLHHTAPETSGNDPEQMANLVQMAALTYGKQEQLAREVHVSKGQLSKMLNGNLSSYCRLLEALGLTVTRTRYLESLREIARVSL